MNRSVSAPGKLFLSGEYAVLWGGAALLAAVGPRMAGWVKSRSDGEVHLVTGAGRLRGRTTPLGVNWAGPVPAPFLFAARGVDEALRAHGAEALGFEPLKVALLAHAKAQVGAGSGGDVAAVSAGGIVRYRRYPLENLAKASALGQLPAALSGAPPVDLRCLPTTQVRLSYAYSGKSASTPAVIAEVEQRLSAGDRERIRTESDQLGRALEESMLRSDFRSLAEAVSGLQRLLSSIGTLETEAIGRILGLARSYGAAAKISGAGRGDGCVLFSPDAETERELLDGIRSRGFWATPLAIEPGMRGEAEIDPRLREM